MFQMDHLSLNFFQLGIHFPFSQECQYFLQHWTMIITNKHWENCIHLFSPQFLLSLSLSLSLLSGLTSIPGPLFSIFYCPERIDSQFCDVSYRTLNFAAAVIKSLYHFFLSVYYSREYYCYLERKPAPKVHLFLTEKKRKQRVTRYQSSNRIC